MMLLIKVSMKMMMLMEVRMKMKNNDDAYESARENVHAY